MDEVKAAAPSPSYASTAQGRIVAWNRAARELLGYDKKQAIGARCWELLRGRDIYGEPFCGPDCPLVRLVARGEPLHRFALNLQRADGRRIALHVSASLLPVEGTSQQAVVHVLDRCRCEGIARGIEHHGALSSPAGPCRGPADLGWRERRILQLLAAGCGTEHIAQRLFMRADTVRNDVRRMRCTLGERSFAEAVAAVRSCRETS
jgi:PAS domain S-box-containing protein